AGTTKRISIDLLEEVQLGDWVLLHVGFALQKIDREQAEETMALFNEMLAIPGAYSGEVALP
ncbi:MAG: HypC/HybG/HupF family hydrogenase formation chaperone, partial [Chloroflexota bacterium]